MPEIKNFKPSEHPAYLSDKECRPFHLPTFFNQFTGGRIGLKRSFGMAKSCLGIDRPVVKWEEKEHQLATFLAFKFKGSRKYNYFRVVLAADDTYSVAIARISSMNHLEKTGEPFMKGYVVEHGVYAEDLQELFEATTGLYTSL